MQILTNRINGLMLTEEIRAKLESDFDVFEVKGAGNEYHNSFLDIATAHKGVLACFGIDDSEDESNKSGRGVKHYYFMLQKGKNNRDLLMKTLAEEDAAAARRVNRAVKIDIKSSVLPDYALWNLLLFNLANPLPRPKEMSRVANALYTYIMGKLEKSFLALALDRSLVLTFNVQTFAPRSKFWRLNADGKMCLSPRAEGMPLYICEGKSPHRYVKNQDKGKTEADLYINRRIREGSKVDVNFIGFPKTTPPYETPAFKKSRYKHIYDARELFNSEYEKYGLKLEFTLEEAEELPLGDEKEQIRYINNALKGRVVNIINTDAAYKDIAPKIEKRLVELTCSDDMLKGMKWKVTDAISEDINLVLIHEKEYYGEGSDLYDQYDPAFCQHMTYENLADSETANNLAEDIDVILKNSILNAVIKESNINGHCVLYDCSRMSTDKMIFYIEQGRMPKEGRSGFYNPVYFRMILYRDGTIELADSESDPTWHDKVAYIFRNRKYARNNKASALEFIVEVDGRLCLVKKPVPGGLTVLPNPKAGLLPDQSDKSVGLRRHIEAYKTGFMNGFVGIYLMPPYYAVGLRKLSGLRGTLRNAVQFREIVDYDNTVDLMRSVLTLMDVPFVRLGQLTVLPFPVKHLREYANLKLKTNKPVD